MQDIGTVTRDLYMQCHEILSPLTNFLINELTLSEKFWRISLYVTYDFIAKLSM